MACGLCMGGSNTGLWAHQVIITKFSSEYGHVESLGSVEMKREAEGTLQVG